MTNRPLTFAMLGRRTLSMSILRLRRFLAVLLLLRRVVAANRRRSLSLLRFFRLLHERFDYFDNVENKALDCVVTRGRSV